VSAYDVVRMDPGEVVTEHYEGKIETDGPWLICYPPGPNANNPLLVTPAHGVYSVKPCTGACGRGGE
jgi:hypothetical protein